MSWPKPPPFFTLPPAGGVPDWLVLPQAVRDQWNAWAQANKIGGPDYQYKIRPGVDAFTFLTKADSAANGGTTSIYLPPPEATPNAKLLNRAAAAASVSNVVALQSASSADGASNVLVFGTAPAATVDALDLTNNKFIGQFSVVIGDPQFTWFDSLQNGYVAAFGSLSGLAGQFLQLWAFNVIGGQMVYAGSWVVTISNMSPANATIYWPMNEATGIRRSLTQPCDLHPIGPLTQTAGLIDFAIQPNTTSPAAASTDVEMTLSMPNDEFSIFGWVKTVPGAGLEVLMMRGEPFPSLYIDWYIGLDTLTGVASFNIWTGAGTTGVALLPGDVPMDNNWHFLYCEYVQSTGDIAIVCDLSAFQLATIGSAMTHLPMKTFIGCNQNQLTGTNCPMCDWCVENYKFAAIDLSVVFNAGAGLRYPRN